MRAVIYARVSSARQRDTNTIASQLRVLPEFVSARGWTLSKPFNHYVDDGCSARAGKLEKREAFARLLADATAGAYDVVAVIDIDRLTRSEDLDERGHILGVFQRAKVRIAEYTTGQVHDLSSSLGDLMSTLRAWFAAEDNRKRATRIAEAKLTAIHRGRKPSGPTPYGLSYERATGQWGHDPDEGPVVKEIYRSVLAGEGVHRIAKRLQASGAPRPRGGKWTHDRVWRIARNTTYRGEYVADKARALVVKVPPIVDDQTWFSANAHLSGKARVFVRAHRVALLEGIGICGVCGTRIRIYGGRRGRRYTCATKIGDRPAGAVPPPGRKRVPRCPNPTRLVDVVDAQIWAELEALATDPARLARAVDERQRSARPEHDWSAELADYEARLARLERAEATILDRFRRGKISPGAMDRETEAAGRERALLERNRDLARQELARAAQASQDADALAAMVGELGARVRSATDVQRRDLVRLLVPGREGLHAVFRLDGVAILGELPQVTPASSSGCSTRHSRNLFRLSVSGRRG